MPHCVCIALSLPSSSQSSSQSSSWVNLQIIFRSLPVFAGLTDQRQWDPSRCQGL